jgi:alkanesulfonate monooxygenase SsuD/methylene tetrahydromethanopterin reductase-like flavin-dependent oxidoreductase (luciferase family)
LKLGALTLPNVPWDELVGWWRRLDGLGFDAIYVADHLGNPYRTQQPWHEGWTCLAALAGATTRARIGPLVSPMTFRNPGVLARAAATVDHASGGRFELGVGAGGSAFDHGFAGVEEWPPAERMERFGTFVERLHGLLRDETLQPRPVQGVVPLTLGGQADPLLQLAARYADGWNTYGGKGLSAEEGLRRSRERNERLSAYCEEAGRDPAALRRSVLLGYSFVAETPFASDDAFLDVARRWRDAGFDELIVYYPADLGAPPGSVDDGVFERAPRELVPRL